jgi:hypothetical protein
MTSKYFNVKTGLTTGNVTLDAATGNISAGNLSVTGVVSAVSLFLSGNVTSNLVPNSAGVLSLGSGDQPFKEVFVSNNISIGNQTITANSSSLEISGNVVMTVVNAASLFADSLTANTANFANINIGNQLVINSNAQSTSTVTGSLTTDGGVGIQKDLYVGGTIHLANNSGGTTSKGSINFNDTAGSIDFNFNR